LNRPRKFLMRFVSSALSSVATEVAVCSKYSLETIAPAFSKVP